MVLSFRCGLVLVAVTALQPLSVYSQLEITQLDGRQRLASAQAILDFYNVTSVAAGWDDEGGVHLKALQSLKKGETWVEIPEGSMIIAGSHNDELVTAMDEFEQGRQPCGTDICSKAVARARLSLRLVFEARLGEESRWRNYLTFLRTVPGDATWLDLTEDQEIVLNGTWDGSHSLAEIWHTRHYLYSAMGSQAVTDLLGAALSKDEVVWAGSIVRNRIYSPDPLKPWLIPVLDLVQAAPLTNSWNDLGASVKRGVVESDIEAGAVLFSNYGTLDNTVLIGPGEAITGLDDFGPPRPVIQLGEVASSDPDCASRSKNLLASAPAGVPDMVLRCEFLSRLESKHATTALQSGYDMLLGKDELPSLECSDDAPQCKITQSPAEDSTTVDKQDLRMWLDAHRATLRHSFTHCGDYLARAETHAFATSLARLAEDDAVYSKTLFQAATTSNAMLERCVAAMQSQMSALTAWQDKALPAVPLTELKFSPGRLGLDFDEDTGVIAEVFPDGLAHLSGVQEGWKIRKIGSQPFARDLLIDSATGDSEYTIAFEGAAKPKRRIVEL